MDHWDDDMYRWDRERDEWDLVDQALLDDWDDHERDFTASEQYHWSYLDAMNHSIRQFSEGQDFEKILSNLLQTSYVDWKRDGF